MIYKAFPSYGECSLTTKHNLKKAIPLRKGELLWL